MKPPNEEEVEAINDLFGGFNQSGKTFLNYIKKSEADGYKELTSTALNPREQDLLVQELKILRYLLNKMDINGGKHGFNSQALKRTS